MPLNKEPGRMPLSSGRALFLFSEVSGVDDLFTIVRRTVLNKMFVHKLSGIDCMVLIALAHCRVGDEIGVTEGGYVMSANDVASYIGDGMTPRHVRKSLSRMVGKGVVFRSRKVKRGGAWLTVYSLAPGDERDDGSRAGDGDAGEGGSQRAGMDQHATNRWQGAPPNGGGAHHQTVAPHATNRWHTSTSTQEVLKREDKIESFSPENDGAGPRYEYPDDEWDVYEQMLSDGIEPETCDTLEVAEKFFDYNESRGWRVSGRPMHDWHAALEGFVRHVDATSFPLTG